MGKLEVTIFKNRYVDYLKNNKSAVCKWLYSAIDFERPDGHYYTALKIS